MPERSRTPGERPAVVYIALGGTIASVLDAAGSGAAPGLSSTDLVSAVPGLTTLADVQTRDSASVGSSELTIADLLALRDTALDAVEQGAVAVVVSQGTDTLEESAFALDLLWDRDEPIVFTAAMRNPSLPGADGPANLLAAVRCAVSPAARGLGVLICVNDEVHAARFVRKAHTTNVATFRSSPLGPLGWVIEDRVRIPLRLNRFTPLAVPTGAEVPAVASLTAVLGDDGRLLAQLPGLGYSGLVLSAMGGGHVPHSWMTALCDLAGRMPVVLGSRAGAGETLRRTYSRAGSEMSLLAAGLIPAGGLHPVKARILLILALAAGYHDSRLRTLFESCGTLTGVSDRDC